MCETFDEIRYYGKYACINDRVYLRRLDAQWCDCGSNTLDTLPCARRPSDFPSLNVAANQIADYHPLMLGLDL